MLNLRPLIVKAVPISWKLDNVRCIRHKNRTNPCKFVVSSSSYCKSIVHCRTQNYEVNNYRLYCQDVPSKMYNLLQYSQKLIFDGTANDDYIKVEKQKVFKIKQNYVTFGFLLHCNEITINGNMKLIGILHYFIFILLQFYVNLLLFYYYFTGKWRSSFVSLYKSTIRNQLALDPSLKEKPNENEIIQLAQKHVPGIKHLREIYYYLFVNNWLPAKGIFILVCLLFYYHFISFYFNFTHRNFRKINLSNPNQTYWL